MNIEDYISSGILESYVLGELSDSQRLDVEKNLAEHPELREELRKIEDVQEALLQKMAITPPARVKEKIMLATKREDNVVVMNASTIRWKYAVAASLVLALSLGYLAYDYRTRWIHAQVALNEMISRNQQVASEFKQVNQRLDKMEADLNVVNNPSFIKVTMKGTANAPQSLASIYWNADTREVYLMVQHMKQLSEESQYQLWAIIDGKPVDAGVFDASTVGLLRMKDIAKNATTFAVTIEPRGGKASPTLSTMQVAGNVKG